MDERKKLKDKQRIVIKIGSSSLTHAQTGQLDLIKLEVLVREVSNLRNQGKDVVLVSSGAIMVGKNTIGLESRPEKVSTKQACAAIGQAKLMMIYQKLFAEYNQIAGQVLITKNTFLNNVNRVNAQNTFEELLDMGVIPIVNENDTISTYELEFVNQFGDNDTLSAIVATMINADLLILLSDIDGLYTDDPNLNKKARFIDVVESVDSALMKMGKSSTSTDVGSGGMKTKLSAAQVATSAGADMIIANGKDFRIIHQIMEGRTKGTLFLSDRKEEFYLMDYIEKLL